MDSIHTPFTPDKSTRSTGRPRRVVVSFNRPSSTSNVGSMYVLRRIKTPRGYKDFAAPQYLRIERDEINCVYSIEYLPFSLFAYGETPQGACEMVDDLLSSMWREIACAADDELSEHACQIKQALLDAVDTTESSPKQRELSVRMA